jgi:hypothetical protein
MKFKAVAALMVAVGFIYMMKDKTPRGIRNNNPGNLERNGIEWLGMSEHQNDARFIVFDSPVFGIRALARLLKTYESKHLLDTVEGIISRYAPSNENNTTAYINHVARAIGVDAKERINVEDHLTGLIKAITKHENGQQPYNDETIQRGIALA